MFMFTKISIMGCRHILANFHAPQNYSIVLYFWTNAAIVNHETIWFFCARFWILYTIRDAVERMATSYTSVPLAYNFCVCTICWCWQTNRMAHHHK